tara:strand:- start:2457 stop:3005 length:549 start_codon:yes stop_codon:yes gene_type:complete
MDINYKKCKRYNKLKNSYRLLLVQTPDYSNRKYLKLKQDYENNKYQYHKYNIKLINYKNKEYKFKIGLIGYDGDLKKIYLNFNQTKIINNIKSMPIGEKESKKDNKALSLYENYNPKTTLKGMGFKNKKTALNTIEMIKDKPIKYQKSVINTMYFRAKHHPHQTKDMKEAMMVFNKWLIKKK